MKRSIRSVPLAAALLLTAASGILMLPPTTPASAETSATLKNVIPESTAVELVAKIRSIDPASRRVILVTSTGSSVRVIAGPGVRLNLLKAGDTVRMKYYRSVAFAISGPQSVADAPPASQTTSLARAAEAPGGAAVRVTKVSGLVVGIDKTAHRVDMVLPGGGAVYTIEVTDPARIAALSQLKVGEAVTATVSEALAVQIEPAPNVAFPANVSNGGSGRGGR